MKPSGSGAPVLSVLSSEKRPKIAMLLAGGKILPRRGQLELLQDIAEQASIDIFFVKKAVGLDPLSEEFNRNDQPAVSLARSYANDLIVDLRLYAASWGICIPSEVPLHHPIEYQLMEFRGCIGEMLETICGESQK